MNGYFKPDITEPLYEDTSERAEDDSDVEVTLTEPPLKKAEQQRATSPLKQESPESAQGRADEDKAASESTPMHPDQQTLLYTKTAKLIARLLDKWEGEQEFSSSDAKATNDRVAYFSQLMQHSAVIASHSASQAYELMHAGEIVAFTRYLGIPATVLDSYLETHYPLRKSFHMHLFEGY